MSKSLNKSAAELWRAINDAVLMKAEPVPSDFRTMRDWAALFHVSLRTMKDRVSVLDTKGLVERRTFRIARSDGRVAPVPHYRIKL
jgi:DNA-binding FadR family transcriptional regulator